MNTAIWIISLIMVLFVIAAAWAASILGKRQRWIPKPGAPTDSHLGEFVPPETEAQRTARLQSWARWQ